MTITPDLQQKIALARQRGMPEDIIAQKVQQYQAQQQQAQPQQSGGVGGFLQNVGESLIRPAVNYGKYVGEAGAQVGRTAFDPTFRKAFMGGQLTPEENQQIAGAPSTLLLDENKVNGLGNIAKTGLKATAGAASYAIPAGGSFVGALGAGALSGGLRDASEDNSTVGSTLRGALGGAAASGLFYGISKIPSLVKNVRGGLANGADNLATGLDTGIVNPKVPATPYGAGKETDIVQGLKDMGITGSAKSQYAQLEPKMNELSGQIKDILSKSDTTAPVEELTNNLKASMSDNINAGDPLFDKAQAKILNKLANLAGDKGELTAQDLFDFKQNLGDQLKRAFVQANKGNSITPAQEAGMTAWENMDNLITGINPAVKDLTTQQSLLYQASKGLQQSANKSGSLEVLGTKLPIGNAGNQLVQGGESKAANLLRGTADTLRSGLPNAATDSRPAAQAAIEQALNANNIDEARGLIQAIPKNDPYRASMESMFETITGNKVGNAFDRAALLGNINKGGITAGTLMNMGNNNKSQEPNYQPMNNGQPSQGQQQKPSQSQTSGRRQLTAQDVADAYIQLPKAEADKVAQYYKLTSPNSAKPMSGANAKVSQDAESGLNSIAQLETELANNPYAPIQAKIPGSPGARVYQQAASEIADVIRHMRARATINDRDYNFYMDKLPSPLDDARTISYKLKSLKDYFSGIRSTTGGQGIDASSLDTSQE